MRRRTFDALVAAAGLLLVVVLVVAGVLLTWGQSYANNQVTSQLSAEKIVFPARSNAEFKALPKADQAVMGQYAGQLMTNGAQAKAYADHFIAYHLTLIGGGKTYSQLSGEALAQPKNAALQGEVQTIFRGTTLRSMLLEAYGFWTFGQIALMAAIASYIAAGLMLILSIFGFAHLRRTPPEAEVLPRVASRVVTNAT
jgi:enamine deaminase RidA (YjgF/YER057c/UK114 family)